MSDMKIYNENGVLLGVAFEEGKGSIIGPLKSLNDQVRVVTPEKTYTCSAADITKLRRTLFDKHEEAIRQTTLFGNQEPIPPDPKVEPKTKYRFDEFRKYEKKKT